MGWLGEWQKRRALHGRQREADSTKCHRKVKEKEEGMSNCFFKKTALKHFSLSYLNLR